MKFEDILTEVGDSGLYQYLLVFGFLMPYSVLHPLIAMSTLLYVSTPEHWCYVPEVTQSTLSTEMQRKLIRPINELSCSRYDINFTQVLLSGNWTVNSSWPTMECDRGWIYDKTNYKETVVTKWNLVCKDDHLSKLVVSLDFFGMMLVTPFTGYLSDNFGRKGTFFIMTLIIAVTEIGSVLSPYFGLFILFRFVHGGMICTQCACASIIPTELVNPNLRTRVVGVLNVGWGVGMCFLPLLAWLTGSWFYLGALISAFTFSMLLFWWFIPESPSWLISKGRHGEAATIMATISRTNSKTAHLGTHLLDTIYKYGGILVSQKMNEEKDSFLDFYRNQTLRKRLCLLIICWMCSFVPFYGHQLNAPNLTGNEFYSFFYLAASEIPAFIITWGMMQSIGRKWSSVIAFSLSTLSNITAVILSKEYTTLVLMAALLAKAGSTSCIMIVYQQAAEIIPTSMRVVGMGLCSSLGSGSTLLSPYIIYLAKYSSSYPFMIFAIMSSIGLVSGLCLPETLNEVLPQTNEDAKNFGKNQKVLQWWRTSRNFPDLVNDSTSRHPYIVEQPAENVNMRDMTELTNTNVFTAFYPNKRNSSENTHL